MDIINEVNDPEIKESDRLKKGDDIEFVADYRDSQSGIQVKRGDAGKILWEGVSKYKKVTIIDLQGRRQYVPAKIFLIVLHKRLSQDVQAPEEKVFASELDVRKIDWIAQRPGETIWQQINRMRRTRGTIESLSFRDRIAEAEPVLESLRLHKGSFVQLIKDITSKGVQAKQGEKGMIDWEGEDRFGKKIKVKDQQGNIKEVPAKVFRVKLGTEYSVSKAGVYYIKGERFIFASESDLSPTTLPGDYWVQKEYKERDYGLDWDDKHPDETWDQFNARMRAYRRSRHPEWGKRW